MVMAIGGTRRSRVWQRFDFILPNKVSKYCSSSTHGFFFCACQLAFFSRICFHSPVWCMRELAYSNNTSSVFRQLRSWNDDHVQQTNKSANAGHFVYLNNL